jgi:DNA-binding NarL/FixJ family response regulator
MTTLLIADDHPLTLLGTKSFVEHLGYTVVESCGNGLSAYTLIKIHNPRIAILDIDMPGLSGLEVLEKLFMEKIRTKVILLTMHKEYSIYKKALEFNIGGYLTKEKAPSELENCIKEVLKGNRYLSESIKNELYVDNVSAENSELSKLTVMERKIIELIGQQKTSKQIANAFFVSEKQIEKHRSNIIEKLNLPKEKNVLLMWAMQNYKK